MRPSSLILPPSGNPNIATVNLVSRKHNAPRRNNTPNHTSPHTSTPHTSTLHTPTSKHTRTSTCPNCTTSHKPGRTNCPARTTKCRNWNREEHLAAKCHSQQNSNQTMLHHDVNTSETFDKVVFDTITSRDEAYTDIHFHHQTRNAYLRVKVDTGAQGNLLPLRTFQKMYPDKRYWPNLQPSSTRLSVYDSSTLTQYGKLELTISSGAHTSEAIFYVVDTPGPVLLGFPSSTALKLVTMHFSVNPQLWLTSTADLVKEYPKCFAPIGNFENFIE